ncbi:hypothetical protein BVRB_013950, partial [Beta vulgaris subsp. vulgaris]
TTTGALSSIVRPTVNAANFELKPQFIQSISNDSFAVLPNECPVTHIASFLEKCDTVKIKNVSEDVIRLRLFPFSLRDRARERLRDEGVGTFDTWRKFAKAFLLQATEQLHQFCFGLDQQKFGTLVSGLLMMDPLPSLNVAYSKIIPDERNQTVSEAQEHSRPDAVGFSTSGGASGRGVATTSSAEPTVCSNCGRIYHDKEHYFELIGWPEGTRGCGGPSSRENRGARSVGRGGGRGLPLMWSVRVLMVLLMLVLLIARVLLH